jgi:hypothetical protein
MKRITLILLVGLLWGCSTSVVEVDLAPESDNPSLVEDLPDVLLEEEVLEEEPEEDVLPSVVFESTGAPVEVCKIEDGLTDFRGPAGIGVDLKGYSFPSSGPLRIAVVYLDFADYRWSRSESTYELTRFLIEPIQDYYDAMSGKRVQFEWVVFDEIVSLPLHSEAYNITRGTDRDRIDIKDAVGRILERRLDFNEWDAIIWGINPDVPERIADVSPTSIIVGPNESYAYHMALIGMDTRRNGYVNIAHEMGHMFGLPDLYVNVCYNNQVCQDGTVNWLLQFQYAGSWSLMSRADHPNNELMGWERFMIGWLNEDEFHCITSKEEHIIDLQSLNAQSGTRLIGVNLSEHKNLIIELRQRAAYCRTCQTGLLVYSVDTKRDSQDGHIHIIRPSHSIEITLEDALLLPKPGFHQVEYEGWLIEILESTEQGFAVRVVHQES